MSKFAYDLRTILSSTSLRSFAFSSAVQPFGIASTSGATLSRIGVFTTLICFRINSDDNVLVRIRLGCEGEVEDLIATILSSYLGS